jgi:hypothetical protein
MGNAITLTINQPIRRVETIHHTEKTINKAKSKEGLSAKLNDTSHD